MGFACPRPSLLASMGCCFIFSSLGAAAAATLTWEGSLDSNWFSSNGSVTNWRDENQQYALPSANDDLVFTSSGTYSGPLTLGGASIALNSIRVGVAGNSASSIFSLDQVFSSNGTIQLGVGGLTAYMPDATATGARNVHFNADFQLATDSFVRSYLLGSTPAQRQVHLNGQVSGGNSGSPITFELSSPDGGAGNTKAIIVANPMPGLYGTLKLNGATYFSATSGAIWGDPTTAVHLSSGGDKNVYAFKGGGDVVVPNNLVLQPGRPVLLSSFQTNSTWTFTGNITGGSIFDPLDLLGDTGAGFVFRGTDQSFSNWVRVRSGTTVTLAGAGSNGVVWPNVQEIRLKFMDNCPGTTALRVQGNYTLNAPINVPEINSSYSAPIQIGQVNSGQTAFDAVFNGKLTVLEDDYQALQLTADAGGSATFNGEINVAGGNYGLDKIGAGTVAVNGHVSQATGNTLPIGSVRVQQGTLQVNNRGGSESFHTSEIRVADGAVLGGSGTVTGDVLLGAGSILTPGSSIGTFTIGGDAIFSAGSVLEMHLNGSDGDRLDVLGLLDLSCSDDTLLFDILTGGAGPTRILASYGSLRGEFDNVFGLPTEYVIDYHYLGQNQIALLAPEPSGLVVLSTGILGIACYGLRQRRRRALKTCT